MVDVNLETRVLTHHESHTHSIEKVHAFTDEVQEMSRGRKKQEPTVTMTQSFGAEDKVNLAMVTVTDGGGVVASRALTWVCCPPKAEGQTGHLCICLKFARVPSLLLIHFPKLSIIIIQ